MKNIKLLKDYYYSLSHRGKIVFAVVVSIVGGYIINILS
jgi:hypothetical protein